VPRPAMLVAIVTAFSWPACATISASRSWFLALRTAWGIPFFLRSFDRRSDFSTETVPTRTGCPFWWQAPISCVAASNFSRSVL